MIGKFSNEAKLSANEVLELLLSKTKRNYTTHGCIEGFIRPRSIDTTIRIFTVTAPNTGVYELYRSTSGDLINDEYRTNDFIQL
jgi:hypothetical protein